MLSCSNATPSRSKNGIPTRSKQEAAMLTAIEGLGFEYEYERAYPLSIRGRKCDVYIPRFNLWIECYGGTIPVKDDREARKYQQVMDTKKRRFREHPEDGRLLVVYSTAIYRNGTYRQDFQTRLKTKITQPSLFNVCELD